MTIHWEHTFNPPIPGSYILGTFERRDMIRNGILYYLGLAGT